jgi:hypothetical protein
LGLLNQIYEKRNIVKLGDKVVNCEPGKNMKIVVTIEGIYNLNEKDFIRFRDDQGDIGNLGYRMMITELKSEESFNWNNIRNTWDDYSDDMEQREMFVVFSFGTQHEFLNGIWLNKDSFEKVK